MTRPIACSVHWILFDFGGVIADEGFRDGLKAIGRQHGLDPDYVFNVGRDVAYASGYVTGQCHEAEYWRKMRGRLQIDAPDASLRQHILSRFVLRPWMLDIIENLQHAGQHLAILSDQVNWLDEINRATPFFHLFDHVFNSFHEGKSKQDASFFTDITRRLGIKPEEALFIDDSAGNIDRARSRGLAVIQMVDRTSFESELKKYCPGF